MYKPGIRFTALDGRRWSIRAVDGRQFCNGREVGCIIDPTDATATISGSQPAGAIVRATLRAVNRINQLCAVGQSDDGADGDGDDRAA